MFSELFKDEHYFIVQLQFCSDARAMRVPTIPLLAPIELKDCVRSAHDYSPVNQSSLYPFPI
jgi:hypothetical protein